MNYVITNYVITHGPKMCGNIHSKGSIHLEKKCVKIHTLSGPPTQGAGYILLNKM